MVAFAKQHGIAIRGHNVIWEDPNFQPAWVQYLPQDKLWDAVNRRINSLMTRYRGQVIAWDVVNENLHFHFYEHRLGVDASGIIYKKASRLDPNTLMFLNDFNTIEQHPAVQGIVLWAAWKPEGCYRMCLTDNNFKNLATGDVVDKLIAEWKTKTVVGTTDANGFFEAQLFHGNYEVRLDRTTTASSRVQSLVVDSEYQQDTVFQINV